MSVKQIEGYQILMNKALGKGSFGSVYIGVKDITNDKVAVKIIPKDASNNIIIKLIKISI